MGEIWGLRANRDKNCEILSNKRKNNVAFNIKRRTSYVKSSLVSYY